MNTPKKISPDRIRDAIIEIRYTSKIPFEIAIGMFYKSLDDTYTYTNRPIGRQQLLGSDILSGLQLQLGSRFLFYNDKIKVELQPNSIVFNCLDNYISWSIYNSEIEKVILQLAKAEVIDTYVQVGVRYISEYIDIDLQNCLRFSFSFGHPEIKSNTYRFHSEFDYDKLKVILNLNNKIAILNQKNLPNQQPTQVISNIDIAIINIFNEAIVERNCEFLLAKIDNAHLKEKEIFFSLLTEDFLKSLNPIY
jgi:uncharacterized protein (TIGR04255 family)